MKRKDIKNEILKYISPKELEEAIEVKNTELKGLLSPEGAEFIIAKELGIKIDYSEEISEYSSEEISEEILFKRFTELIKELRENNDFLEVLSQTLGEIFAHNHCCHQGHIIPDIEDIDFRRFVKEIKTSFYEARIRMNEVWYFQLKKPQSSGDTEAYEGNKETYEHFLKHAKEGLF